MLRKQKVEFSGEVVNVKFMASFPKCVFFIASAVTFVEAKSFSTLYIGMYRGQFMGARKCGISL